MTILSTHGRLGTRVTYKLALTESSGLPQQTLASVVLPRRQRRPKSIPQILRGYVALGRKRNFRHSRDPRQRLQAGGKHTRGCSTWSWWGCQGSHQGNKPYLSRHLVSRPTLLFEGTWARPGPGGGCGDPLTLLFQATGHSPWTQAGKQGLSPHRQPPSPGKACLCTMGQRPPPFRQLRELRV